MPRSYGRNRRVADQLQRELAVLLQRELDRTRAGLVTVSAADVSPDLSRATVYFTCIGGEAAPGELEAELNDMAGHFRHELARILPLRIMPRLRFQFDASVERGSRLSNLIESLNKPRS